MVGLVPLRPTPRTPTAQTWPSSPLLLRQVWSTGLVSVSWTPSVPSPWPGALLLLAPEEVFLLLLILHLAKCPLSMIPPPILMSLLPLVLVQVLVLGRSH